MRSCSKNYPSSKGDGTIDVAIAIDERRAYRSFDPVDIDDATVKELAKAASLAPSCFNNQPWRFVFVRSRAMLDKMKAVFNKGNEWCTTASMVIAVFSEKKLDCNIKEREYYLFDTGIGVGFLVLRATELGLVAHPIAGYDENKVRETLGIPADNRVITLILVGKHSSGRNPLVNDKQWNDEQKRPERKPQEMFAFLDNYSTKP